MPDAACAANETVCRKEADMKSKKITILYERLSKEDERENESLSIEHQKMYLQDCAARNGLTNIIHLTDDGWSGTRWDRPGVVRMMDEVEAGNVQALLVMDMSRLGRDHLRVGLLLESLREKKVRLIAAGEGIDTAKGEDDFMPFRNLFSEWYARDTSRKIKAIFKARMENGKRCSGAIPYGYLRNNGSSQDLIIDDEAAEVVRRIFRMIIDGNGITAIARTLLQEQVPIPSEHWKRIGMEVRSQKYSDPYGWTPTTVAYIVGKPEYKGTVVLGKTKNATYKGTKRAVKTSPEEWYVFNNAIPAIVDAETWENAQRLKRTVRRAPKCDEAPNPLTGVLFCADCGAKMSHRRCKNKDGYRENAYTCSRHRGITKLCTQHYISTRAAEKIILDVLRRVCRYARGNEAEFVGKIREASALRQENAVRDCKKLLAKSKRRADELNGLIRKLYEGNASGKISDKHFERMMAEYDAEQETLENKITELEVRVAGYNADSVRADMFMELAKRYMEFDTLTAPMLNEFIEKVVVHEKDKSSGKRVQKVDVYLNFIGNFTLPEDFDGYSPEERAAINSERERLDKKRTYERERIRRKKEACAG